MTPTDIPESLLALFGADVEPDEKVETKPAPTKRIAKMHDESVAYAFASSDSEQTVTDSEPEFFNESRCWDNADVFRNPSLGERPVIYRDMMQQSIKEMIVEPFEPVDL